MEQKKIKLLKVNGVCSASHLDYADDLLLFCKAPHISQNEYVKVLKEISNRTGLMENTTNKSGIFFSWGHIGTRNPEALFELDLVYSQSGISGYLSLLEGWYPMICVWLVDLIDKMVERWKSKFLYQTGKLQLRELMSVWISGCPHVRIKMSSSLLIFFTKVYRCYLCN